MRRVLVTLHDVTPRHETAIDRMLALLARLAVPPVPLLVVPDFHGQWPLDRHPGFADRLRAWREAGHELVLHGYWHRELPSDSVRGGFGDGLRRGLLTGGEGEFLALDSSATGARLDEGLAMWERAGLGAPPAGFIPPAWLHNDALDAQLWNRGFQWTEDHAGLRYRDGAVLPNPVISWASRDRIRRLGSRVVCPTLEFTWRAKPVVRIALHPHDLDWPALEASLVSVLRRASLHGVFADAHVVRPGDSPTPGSTTTP